MRCSRSSSTGISSRLPSGWATLVILITIFAGTQLLCIGLVGAYVGAIYAEVKRRPHYIVDEIINFAVEGAPLLPGSRHASERP